MEGTQLPEGPGGTWLSADKKHSPQGLREKGMNVFSPLPNKQNKDGAESKADLGLLGTSVFDWGGGWREGGVTTARSSLRDDTIGYSMAGEMCSRQRYAGSCKNNSQGSDPAWADMEGSPEEVMLDQKAE